MIREVHGLAHAKKICAASGHTQSVTISDDFDYVRLDMGASSYPAGLTPSQAKLLARFLIASANRVLAYQKAQKAAK